MKILNVIGTRPEAIKMAPVVMEFSKVRRLGFESLTCITGQHNEMLSPILNAFSITPDFDLNIRRKNQNLIQLLSEIMINMDELVEKIKPDWIISQGDTTTVLAAALTAHYKKIKFAHIEAGLRTGNKFDPFPEEGNRIIVDSISDKLFVPTKKNYELLIREGIDRNKIEVVGNTVVDALHAVLKMDYDWDNGPLRSISKSDRLVLVTAHRRESFGAPFKSLCCAIKNLAAKYSNEGIKFIFPVHLNPNVQKPVYEILGNDRNIVLIDPLDYVSLINLMKNCELILTDSGGIQEEAPTLGIPLLIMRDTTERPEGVEMGLAKLVGTNTENIVNEASNFLNLPGKKNLNLGKINPYGDGNSSKRIIKNILGI